MNHNLPEGFYYVGQDNYYIANLNEGKQPDLGCNGEAPVQNAPVQNQPVHN